VSTFFILVYGFGAWAFVTGLLLYVHARYQQRHHHGP
jgi:hypothetical protein